MILNESTRSVGEHWLQVALATAHMERLQGDDTTATEEGLAHRLFDLLKDFDEEDLKGQKDRGEIVSTYLPIPEVIFEHVVRPTGDMLARDGVPYPTQTARTALKYGMEMLFFLKAITAPPAEQEDE